MARSVVIRTAGAASLVVASALGGLVGFATPGGSSVPRALSDEDCTVLTSFNDGRVDNVTEDPLEALVPADLRAAADSFTDVAAEIRDKRVKKALKKTAKTLDKAADAPSKAEAGRAFLDRGYDAAVTTWTREAAQCYIRQATNPTLP